MWIELQNGYTMLNLDHITTISVADEEGSIFIKALLQNGTDTMVLGKYSSLKAARFAYEKLRDNLDSGCSTAVVQIMSSENADRKIADRQSIYEGTSKAGITDISKISVQ